MAKTPEEKLALTQASRKKLLAERDQLRNQVQGLEARLRIQNMELKDRVRLRFLSERHSSILKLAAPLINILTNPNRVS